MIVIVDYRMGNVGSIVNMLKKIGAAAKVSSEVQDIREATKLILPGVGAFDNGMANLAQMGFMSELNDQVLNKKTPLLGICLGMELLTKGSEEGKLPGLGWIDADTIRFRFEPKERGLKIPHMGWNSTTVTRSDTLFKGLDDDARFYFVHSYHVVCHNDDDVLARTHHGYDFDAAVQRENIFGTQFHPEKSHKYGMQVLRNFVELGSC